MFRPGSNVTIPPMVSVFDAQVGWVDESIAASAPASANWPFADQAYFWPIILPASCTVRRVWWANGATVNGAATIEVGIYADDGDDKPGTRVVSGSALQSGTNTVQFVDTTDVIIGPGLYFIAAVSDSVASVTAFRSLLDAPVEGGKAFRQASITSLPASATPTQAFSTAVLLVGFSTVASP